MVMALRNRRRDQAWSCRICRLVNLNPIVRQLNEQRRELLEQLAAVDAAIAALANLSTAVPAVPPADPDVPVELAAGEIVPRRVKAKRVLSDSHKHALVVSKRRARGVKEAAKGIARDLQEDSFVPGIGKRGDRQAPRLVKRPGRK